MVTIEKYSLSKDKKGVCAWYSDEKFKLTFYHIHSDELSLLEEWIRDLLLFIPQTSYPYSVLTE